MADFSKDDLKEVLRDVLDKFGSKTDDLVDALDDKAISTEKQQKMLERTTDKMAKLEKQFRSGKLTAAQFQQRLEDLGESVEDLDDGLDKSIFQVKKDALAREAATKAFKESVVSWKSAGKAAGATLSVASSALTGFTGALINALEGNGNGVQVSTDLLSAGIDQATKATSAVTGGLQTVGTAAMAMPNLWAKAGGLLVAGTGAVADFMMSTASELAKQGLGLINTEIQKNITAFHDSTKAGMLFADGLTGIRNGAADASLTVDQFGNVVKQNSENIAKSGLGLTTGLQTLSKTTGEIRRGNLGKQLQRLGYSFEEQGNLVAEVMGNLGATGSVVVRDQKALAVETGKYAKSLQVISAITGEDAKAKEAEAKQASMQVAFRAKLMELEKKQPGVTNEILNSMKTMSKSQQNATMQMMTLGGATTDLGFNIQAATDPRIRGNMEKLVSSMQSGTYQFADGAKLVGEQNSLFRQNIDKLAPIGVAGIVGGLGELNSALSDSLNMSDKLQNGNQVDQAIAAQEKLAVTTDRYTNEVIGADNALQDMRTELQKEILPVLSEYASVSRRLLNQALELEKKAIDAAKKEAGISTKPKEPEKITDNLGKDVETVGMWGAGIGAALTLIGAAASVTGIGAAAGVPLMSAGVSMMGGSAGVMGAGAGLDLLGFAEGGIASGPKSGFQTTLHGTEAVVPLPDGRKIPTEIKSLGNVAIDSSSFQPITSMLTAQAADISSMLEKVKDINISPRDVSSALSTVGLNNLLVETLGSFNSLPTALSEITVQADDNNNEVILAKIATTLDQHTAILADISRSEKMLSTLADVAETVKETGKQHQASLSNLVRTMQEGNHTAKKLYNASV